MYERRAELLISLLAVRTLIPPSSLCAVNYQAMKEESVWSGLLELLRKVILHLLNAPEWALKKAQDHHPGSNSAFVQAVWKEPRRSLLGRVTCLLRYRSSFRGPTRRLTWCLVTNDLAAVDWFTVVLLDFSPSCPCLQKKLLEQWNHFLFSPVNLSAHNINP